MWTTEPFRKNNHSRTNVQESLNPSVSFLFFVKNLIWFNLIFTFQNINQPSGSVQKFGNMKNTPSPSMLIGHEGKYTPSSSVPDLAQK